MAARLSQPCLVRDGGGGLAQRPHYIERRAAPSRRAGANVAASAAIGQGSREGGIKGRRRRGQNQASARARAERRTFHQFCGSLIINGGGAGRQRSLPCGGADADATEAPAAAATAWFCSSLLGGECLDGGLRLAEEVVCFWGAMLRKCSQGAVACGPSQIHHP